MEFDLRKKIVELFSRKRSAVKLINQEKKEFFNSMMMIWLEQSFHCMNFDNNNDYDDHHHYYYFKDNRWSLNIEWKWIFFFYSLTKNGRYNQFEWIESFQIYRERKKKKYILKINYNYYAINRCWRPQMT